MIEPIWQPSPQRIAESNLQRFIAAQRSRLPRADYTSLYDWSIAKPAEFWEAVWKFCGVRSSADYTSVLKHGDKMPGARWFEGATLSFTANLLQPHRGGTAIVFANERGERSELTWAELASQVAGLAAGLRALGVGRGDRVAGFVANRPEAVVAMLAAASVGAVWSSCSPDFGTDAVLDRFGQIAPKVLFATDGYFYNGRSIDSLPVVRAIAARLPELRAIVVIPYRDGTPELRGVPNGMLFADLIDTNAKLELEAVPFAHPLYILYSSGTTGVPKCIVHGAGGTLIQHLKEHQLHCDIGPDDHVFYFTTCGWMMWNWLVTALASEATIVLYDGSPFHPASRSLFDLADRLGVTLFGTSAKFIDAVHKAGLSPRETHDLGTVRTITSTGSPLSPESFDFVYRSVKADVHLASISGGTDIVSCFAGGNPNLPVWRGELQVPGLGMDVDVFDDEGRSLQDEPGELVCKAPFPSMPVGFWNDPDGAKYRAAYFERFPGVWCHGDWIRATEHGGYVIYGRSDATLKPGGVRIGTAEIYRQVEQLPEVVESLAVGQEWEGDERIVLFVRLRPGLTLDDALRERIRGRIRSACSPHHVPRVIAQVADIPRTLSGKITEIAVRDVIHGRPVINTDALANPESLALFRNLPELTVQRTS